MVTTETILLESKFIGAILGGFVGDACGILLDGEQPENCHAWTQSFEKSIQDGKLDMATLNQNAQKKNLKEFGNPSKGGLVIYHLLQSLVQCRKFNVDDFIPRFVSVFDDEVDDTFSGIAKVAAALKRGVAWDKAARPKGITGNNAATRSALFGLLYHGNPSALVDQVTYQCSMTHKDQRCVAGAIIVAGTISFVLAHPYPEPVRSKDLLDYLESLVSDLCPQVVSQLDVLRQSFAQSPESASSTIRQISRSHEGEHGTTGISGYVTSSVFWALYSFLRSPDNFTKTLITAINGGGVTESISIIAGFISGAYLGIENLPDILYKQLHLATPVSFTWLDLAGGARDLLQLRNVMNPQTTQTSVATKLPLVNLELLSPTGCDALMSRFTTELAESNAEHVFEDTQLSTELWAKIGTCLPKHIILQGKQYKAIGLNSSFTITKSTFTLPPTPSTLPVVYLYLNSSFIGGAYKQDVSCLPSKGIALIVPGDYGIQQDPIKEGSLVCLQVQIRCDRPSNFVQSNWPWLTAAACAGAIAVGTTLWKTKKMKR